MIQIKSEWLEWFPPHITEQSQAFQFNTKKKKKRNVKKQRKQTKFFPTSVKNLDQWVSAGHIHRDALEEAFLSQRLKGFLAGLESAFSLHLLLLTLFRVVLGFKPGGDPPKEACPR